MAPRLSIQSPDGYFSMSYAWIKHEKAVNGRLRNLAGWPKDLVWVLDHKGSTFLSLVSLNTSYLGAFKVIISTS